MRKASTAGFAVLLAVAASPSPASAEYPRVKACFNLSSNAEQRDCLRDLHRAVSTELDEVFRRKIDDAAAIENSKPPGRVSTTPSWPEAIAASQKAWEAYREAECWGVVGRPGGTGRLGWVYGCLAEKTLERIEELKVPFDQR